MTGGQRLAALFQAGRFEEAVQAAQAMLREQPANAGLHALLAKAQGSLGRPREAEAAYRKAVELEPTMATAWSSLGQLLSNSGRMDEAIECMRRAVTLVPGSATTWNRTGNVLRAAARLPEAQAAYREAIKLDPLLADAHGNLGSLLNQLGATTPAEAALRRGIELSPGRAEFHSNLGNLLKDQGLFAEASKSYAAAVERDPNFAMARSNYLFCLNYVPGVTHAQMKAAAQAYGAWANSHVKVRPPPRTTKPGGRHLRVGFVSGDLRAHPVGYFLEGVLEHWPADRVELVAYPTTGVADQLTARIKGRFSRWTPIGHLRDEQAAAQVAADGIDVLVDLSGHTAHNRLPLFAWRPAPVQASWLGYFATTGVEQMDWLLTDDVSVHPEDEDAFTERIWRLPRTRLCFTPPRGAPEVAPLPAATDGVVTFGSFQVLAKLNDGVLALWSRVMQAVPASRLRVQNAQFGDPNEQAKFGARLAAAGIEPSRVRLLARQPRREYFAAHAEVDVILDTFPYPGGTTTCEALWMGVPTLTLTGESLVARQGESVMTAAGLPQWVARDADEFVARAVQVCGDLPALAKQRSGMREQVKASALFDGRAFARDLADAFEAMAAM